MQTITDDLKSEQLRQDQKYYRIVELYKRYWHNGDQKYKWEAVLNIDSYVIKVSTAKWKLDVREFNEWKSPNFQVDVENRRNIWSELETTGIWNTGTNKPYVPELSKIRVRVGQYLENGAAEDKYIFTGIINQPIAFRDDGSTATIYCVGMDEILSRADADELSTDVDNELLGSNSGTEFYTDYKGVGMVMIVKKGTTSGGHLNAVVLTPGIDYDISDLNEKNSFANITLAVALTSGYSVWGSYYYWYQDKNLSWIVEQLLILGGITNYNVSPTFFSTSVKNIVTLTTQADWQEGTHEDTEDSSSPGDVVVKRFRIIDDFADGNYTSNPVWTVRAGTWEIISMGGIYRLKPTVNGARITTPSTKAYGWWSFWFFPDYEYPYDVSFSFISNGTGTDANEQNGRYRIRIQRFGYSGERITLDKLVNGNWINIIDTGGIYYMTERFFISRTTDGLFTIYNPLTTQTWTGTDNTYTTSNYFHLEAANVSNLNVGFGDFLVNYPPAGIGEHSIYRPISGRYVTKSIDATVDVIAWGNIISSDSVSGEFIIETYSSDTFDFSSGNDPQGWVILPENQIPQSAVKRYLRVRITLKTIYLKYPLYAILHYITISYYTSTTTIPLVDLTGMSILQAIQEIAKMPCYEIGFGTDECFFYRSRITTSPPVLTISAMTNLEKELSFDWGTDKIKNVIDVTFGEYRTVVTPDSKSEAHPHSVDKFGAKKYNISGSTLLPREGADIATAVAETIYDYIGKIRKQAQVQMKFLLQHELGDVIKYEREHKLGRWLWGDGDRTYGNENDPDFVYYADPDTVGWNINMKIEGLEMDTENYRMRIDLVEVI